MLKNLILWGITAAAGAVIVISFVLCDYYPGLMAVMFTFSTLWMITFIEVNYDYIFEKKIPLKRLMYLLKGGKEYVLRSMRRMRCKPRSRRAVHLPDKGTGRKNISKR